jgi:hypothetical protein
MIAAILGFIPADDRRLSIAIKSGTAAKVVPKPATRPKTSDRLNCGMSMLCVLCTNSLQLQSMIRVRRRTVSRLDRPPMSLLKGSQGTRFEIAISRSFWEEDVSDLYVERCFTLGGKPKKRSLPILSRDESAVGLFRRFRSSSRHQVPATCSRVIRAAMSSFATCSHSRADPRANKSRTRATIPVHPVWWLAPRPAPLSP